jgi:probable F420-dependent oxidoreductase
MAMKITYGPWGQSLGEMAEAARAAEQAGAETVWAPEMHRSATISAAALATATETARVGTAIVLAFTRSPMVTALEALDLDELSDGRFILGLGTGVQRLNESWHNARWGRPVPHLRETVRDIRAFVATSHTGEPISLEGEFEPMNISGYERPWQPVRDAIPIYLGAMGPAMTRLAGEIGDGWISHELCSPRYLKQELIPWLEEGAIRGGRTIADVDVVVSALCAISPDASAAKRWAAGTVGFYASVRTYQDFFAFHGLGEDQAKVVELFRSGVGADYLADAVSDEMVDALTLAGTGADVKTRLSGFEGLANTIKLTPPTHGLRPEETRNCQEEILNLIPELI